MKLLSPPACAAITKTAAHFQRPTRDTDISQPGFSKTRQTERECGAGNCYCNQMVLSTVSRPQLGLRCLSWDLLSLSLSLCVFLAVCHSAVLYSRTITRSPLCHSMGTNFSSGVGFITNGSDSDALPLTKRLKPMRTCCLMEALV